MSSDLRTTTSLLGLSTALFLSGVSVSASHLTLPILQRLEPVSAAVDVFQELYSRGLVTAIPLMVVSAVSSGAAAYLARDTASSAVGSTASLQQQQLGYAIAAVVTLGWLPWTQLVMMSTNQRLLAIHERVNVKKEAINDEKEVRDLLSKWRWMNLTRAAMTGAGGVIGLLTFAGLQ